MDGKSLNIKQDHIEKLKTLFPEAITEGQVDWEKLKATLGEDINFSNERYVLNWAGKSDAFKVLQELTTATLVPDTEESVNFDNTNHLFIEGENLEVLKALQKSYYGKVKMVYIDPPYNTGNDHFIYPDRFSESKEDYLKRVGEKDEEGYLTREGMYRKNSKESGHYHSNWMNMMYPRLFLARNLLKDDGLIFVSIDDNEVHNLRLLMNESFGEESFLSQFIWKRRQNVDSRSKNGASVDHEYIVCYRKTEKGVIRGAEKDLDKYSNPDNDPSGDWMSADMTGLATKDQRPNLHYDLTNPVTGITYKCPPTGWRYEPKRMKELIKNCEIIFPDNSEGRPRRKKFQKDLESEYTGFSTVLKTVFNTQGTREVRTIFNEKEFFDFPKPRELIRLLIQQGTSSNPENEIVLDFFSGSGTTAHAVLELNQDENTNRRFICVQLPEECDIKGEAYQAGYKTIADIAKERIRRVIKKIKQEQKENKNLFSDGEKKIVDLGFKVFKLQQSNFKIWRGDKFENGKQLAKQLHAFTDPTKEGSAEKNMLYELLLKSGFDLNSNIENKGSYFVVNGNKIVVALTKMSEVIVKEIIALKPEKCIALDKLFANNDQLKTNTVLQMKDAGIEFKTI